MLLSHQVMFDTEVFNLKNSLHLKYMLMKSKILRMPTKHPTQVQSIVHTNQTHQLLSCCIFLKIFRELALVFHQNVGIIYLAYFSCLPTYLYSVKCCFPRIKMFMLCKQEHTIREKVLLQLNWRVWAKISNHKPIPRIYWYSRELLYSARMLQPINVSQVRVFEFRHCQANHGHCQDQNDSTAGNEWRESRPMTSCGPFSWPPPITTGNFSMQLCQNSEMSVSKGTAPKVSIEVIAKQNAMCIYPEKLYPETLWFDFSDLSQVSEKDARAFSCTPRHASLTDENKRVFTWDLNPHLTSNTGK